MPARKTPVRCLPALTMAEYLCDHQCAAHPDSPIYQGE